jgi:predicted ferric reductase
LRARARSSHSITSKAARIWAGGPTVFDVHQFTSLLALAFGLFHGLILLGDAYIDYTLAQVLVPFGSGTFRPLWVGLGQLALYLLAVVGLSFYVRSWIGRRTWRMIHFLSFAVLLLALAHGIGSGTDTALPWVRAMYWFSGGSLLFLTLYRVLIGIGPAKSKPAAAQDRVGSSI